ncbi:hypothetical protein K2Y11_04090 [bacterium]|nr:hypothetical protein [bacterium]
MLPHIIRLHGPWQVGNPPGDTWIGTIDIPGTISVADEQGTSLRRPFQWVAPLQADEKVSLLLEGITPSARVMLNGEEIGSTSGTWDAHRFDVTDKLKPRNELILHFESGFDRAGIRRQVILSVESALAIVMSAKWNWNEPTEANALHAQIQLHSSSPPMPVEILIDVNGANVLRQSFSLEGYDQTIDLSAGPIEVDPWRPRYLGLPVRNEVRLLIRRTQDGQSILHDETFLAGFRHLDLLPDYDKPTRIDVDRRRELRMARIGSARMEGWDGDDLLTLLGEDSNADMIVLESVLGPDRLYELTDRMGILVRHEVVGDPSLERAVRRLSHHPSVLIEG